MVKLKRFSFGRRGSKAKGEDAADLPDGALPPSQADGSARAAAADSRRRRSTLADFMVREDAAEVAKAAEAFEWDEHVGSEAGVEVWRVENSRTDGDNPDFGIKSWPRMQYGQFYRGDTYIVLKSIKKGTSHVLWHDIYFWIGSESTQDEYGVAAYKVCELDELLGGKPVQHREIEGKESKGFSSCFPQGITYLEGGVDSGFRHMSFRKGRGKMIPETHRLYRVYRASGERVTRCFEVPLSASSLNDGDAFILDAGEYIFTWFGRGVSAFEKSKAATVVTNLKENRLGSCTCKTIDPGQDDGRFWSLLGGKGEVRRASVAIRNDVVPTTRKMYVVSDASGQLKKTEVPFSRKSLVSDDVCIVDVGGSVYVWVGEGSTLAEKQQSMMIVDRHLREMGRAESTRVERVMEGEEKRCPSFAAVF
ncbi:hypothetical protein ACHAXT_002274 [Thalassiosira profunda]